MKKPMCLIIRDGWGHSDKTEGNAIAQAPTPRTDGFTAKYPHTLIECHGEYVGLTPGNQGNSEVGHLNIGAGRVVYQSLTRINKSIKDGDFFTNKALLNAVRQCQEKGSTLHIMGLVQDQGVHAVTDHAVALLELCKRQGFANVLVHAFTDGRDTPPKSAATYLRYLQDEIDRLGTGRIASLIGRYYAMDRDKRWDRVEKAYRALAHGEGETVDSWSEGVDKAYAAGENDEFFTPKLIDFDGVKDGDAIICFNYRLDRARELTQAFIERDFSEFTRKRLDIEYVAFTHYYDGGEFTEAFSLMTMDNILGEFLANNGRKQLRCAETEKYAHVTFFFNGQQETPFDLEDRILINSPQVATYDQKPEMSAYEVRDKALEAVKSGKYDVIIMNFANGDMVGHTGVMEAVQRAVTVVDECTGAVVDAVLEAGGQAIVTADHGNAEKMLLDDGSPMTAHTTNKVPFILIGAGAAELRKDGKLADIAPTMLDLMGIEPPAEMTGRSMIIQ